MLLTDFKTRLRLEAGTQGFLLSNQTSQDSIGSFYRIRFKSAVKISLLQPCHLLFPYALI